MSAISESAEELRVTVARSGRRVATRTARTLWWNRRGLRILSLAAGLLAVSVIGLYERSFPATFLISLLLLMLGLAACSIDGNPQLRSSMRWQFAVTFGLRLAVTALLHFWLSVVYPNPVWYMAEDGGDEIGFYDLAGRWASSIADGSFFSEEAYQFETDSVAWTVSGGLVRFVAATIGGDTFFNMKVLASFFGALTVPLTFRLALLFFAPRVAATAALLVLLAPDYWLLSASLMRDVMISCVVALVVYLMASAVDGRWKVIRLAAAAILGVFVLRHLKVWLAEALFGFGIAWWVRTKILNRTDVLARATVLMVFVAGLAVISLSPALPWIVDNAVYFGEPMGLSDRLSAQRTLGIDESGSSLGGRFLAFGPAAYIPANLTLLLLQVPPWDSVARYGWSPRAITDSAAAFLWYPFVVFLPAGLIACREHRTKKTIWIWGTGFGLLLLLSLASTTVPRWRLMAMPFLLIVAAAGINHPKARGTARSSAVMIVAILLLYVVLKYWLFA